jgi:hypothetical protein
MGNMAKKRDLRKPKEIREMIEESGMKFVMLNNRLFDDFYTRGKVVYRPILVGKNGDGWLDHKGITHPYSDYSGDNNTINVTFDERDFILVILLKFLSQINYQGYTQEIADYLNNKCNSSDKRIKERLKKLQFIQGTINNIYHHKDNNRVMFPDGTKVRLINEEKVEGYENGSTKRTFYKWHLNFDCDYKRENKEGKEVDTPINFFKVTIYDLDLYTSGLLNDKEFITYLYFIRANNKEEKQIWHSVEKLSQKLNIKDTSITNKIVTRLLATRVKDQFCNDGEDFPLVHVDRPANYERKIRERLQPSSYYKPIYNTSTLNRLNDDNPNPYETEIDHSVPVEPETKDEKPIWAKTFVSHDNDLSYLDELD